MLVCPIEAFRDYQLNNAWVWEHQALTRARFCAGDPEVGAQFEAIRIRILRQPRDLVKLKQEVLAMRQKMLDSHASRSPDYFDLKQDPGGIIDVEFMVQYLVLGHASTYPRLCGNVGNIALIRIAAELGLIQESLAEPVGNAYREYRRMQHAIRLSENAKGRIERAAVAGRIEAVRALWDVLFEPESNCTR
jgi:glutamate-ammonia-ligase adenylyltransferase